MNDLLTARHEAAHAVAILRAGADPYIDLGGRPDAEAVAGCERGAGNLTATDLVLIDLAGIAVVLERHRIDQREEAANPPALKDWKRAVERCNAKGWDVEEKLSETRAWVLSERHAIEAVARALLSPEDRASPIVASDEIRRIINHADELRRLDTHKA